MHIHVKLLYIFHFRVIAMFVAANMILSGKSNAIGIFYKEQQKF